jgi:hypothetical protein
MIREAMAALPCYRLAQSLVACNRRVEEHHRLIECVRARACSGQEEKNTTPRPASGSVALARTAHSDTRTSSVSYRLSAEQLAALRRRAEEHSIGIAELIRRTLQELAGVRECTPDDVSTVGTTYEIEVTLRTPQRHANDLSARWQFSTSVQAVQGRCSFPCQPPLRRSTR